MGRIIYGILKCKRISYPRAGIGSRDRMKRKKEARMKRQAKAANAERHAPSAGRPEEKKGFVLSFVAI